MIYIGIGSNLGNRIENIEKAKCFLSVNGIKIQKSSNYYETQSWPDPTKPKFINVVIQVRTKISPTKFIEISKDIEKKLGRNNNFRNSPRTCDIDIISYNEITLFGKLNIPHKKMHKRNFVLIPLYEINQKWFHPKLKKNIKELIFSLPIKDIRSIKQI